MIASIDIFEVLKGKLGETEARMLVKEMEKIDASIETKVEKAFENKKDVLATKEDIKILEVKIAENKSDLIKWMFIFWASQLIAMITFLKLFK